MTLKIRRVHLADTSAEERAALLQRIQQADSPELAQTVHEVVDGVRARGDQALVDYTASFDGVTLEADHLRVDQAELEGAGDRISADLRDAIDLAVDNIRSHHRAQIQSDWKQEVRSGILTGERWTPIASAGLYVPRGKGSFPSVMAMLSVPATLAEVPTVVVCTPPGPDGEVDAASLYAAHESGITTIFRVGGAQAIAALAYGTERIPKVEKIVGPGNQYVTYAKRLVYGVVDPGPPAGPSESIILADGHAPPDLVSRELMVEAEHGPDSAALLVTDSHRLADQVAERLPPMVADLPEPRRTFCETVFARFGGIVVAEDLDAAIAFANDWAPEHLHVLTENPFGVLPRLTNSGEVLLGEFSSIAYGNYAIGVNAILPTGGFARSYSCVGVDDFVKRSSFAHVSQAGARQIGPAAITLAEYEGFPAHAAAAREALERAR